ncbi:FimV/HubP family polar landmark protein [Pandoraea pnomenusa]|uniref:FimV/HubP family polar landmark protein n=1 Tax=Pandoraea pnomenusa TaxID=93220 RepID=UPI00333FD788
MWSLGLLNAGAAEFGPQQVRSGPGQPLRAVIVLGNVSQAEADGLSVKLAPRDAFKQAGLRYDPTLEKLSVSVSPTGGREPGYSGTYLVHVDSAEPVSTSFLDLLLVVEWRTGRQSNAVTLSAIPEASLAQPQAVVPAATADSTVSAAPAATASAPAPAASEATATPAANAEGARKVGRGDSLSSIAREFTGGEGGTTLAQMMTALFEANRSAFIGNDPNRLRQGATLARPADAQVQSIPPAQARKFVSAAREQFDAYRARLADSTAQQAAPAGGRSAQGAIEAGKAPEAAAPATRDELKLSRPGKGAAGGTAARAGGSEEEQIAQGKAQAEAQGRVNELQKNVADLQKLLAMKNQAAAKLEEQAATASGVPAQDQPAKSAEGKTTAPAAAATSAPAPTQDATAKEADATASAATTAVASDAAAETASAAPAASAGASEAIAAAAPVSEAAAAAPASAAAADVKTPNAGMNWRAVSQNPYVLPGAGVLVVLLGLWWLMRRRRAEPPVGQPGPYDDGHDGRSEPQGEPASHGATAAGVAGVVGASAAGAAGAAAMYAAHQAEADEHLHPAADDAWQTPNDGVAALDAAASSPAAAEADDAWNAEQDDLTGELADTAHAEGLGEPPVVEHAAEAVAEPLADDAAAQPVHATEEAASEPEIDWDAAFAEQAGEVAPTVALGDAPAAHEDPAAASLASLEALSAAAAVGGIAAGQAEASESHTEPTETTDHAQPDAPVAEPVVEPQAGATPDGGVAGMLGDLDLGIPGQPSHVGTIASDALPSLTKGIGSVQFTMAPPGDPLHQQADQESDADLDGELSDADFDAAMQQVASASEAPRSYTDAAHEAPSLKPMSFDLSDFSLDLKGDDTPSAPASASAPVLPAATGVEALVEHETLASPAPSTPFAAEPAAPQVPAVAPVASAEPIAPRPAGGAEVPDEFHTKLELAAAYQTIGDDDGARELLEEVIAGGDAAQQSVARTRLAELGK